MDNQLNENQLQPYSKKRSPYPDKIQPEFYESNNLPSQYKNQQIFRAKAFWPLDFFPDELVVQEKTVSIIRKEFLLTYVDTMPISDIGEVAISMAGPFAALTILGKNPQHQMDIKNLPKSDAEKAKTIIEKLMIGEAK